MSHRYRPSSKCLRARKKKQIWVTYLHNNVGLRMKHLRSGTNWACVARLTHVSSPPSSLRRLKTDILCYLFIYFQAACKLVVLSMSWVDSFMHSINVVDIGQLSTRGWIEVRWCQHFGQSRLQPRNLYMEIPSSKWNAHFLGPDQMWALHTEMLQLLSRTTKWKAILYYEHCTHGLRTCSLKATIIIKIVEV